MNKIGISLFAVFFAVKSFAMLPLAEGVKVIDTEKKFFKMITSNPDLVIDHVSALGYEVYGPKGLEKYLKQQNIPFVQEEQIEAGGYPSAEAVIQKMNSLAQAYPKLITLTEIGKSVEGRSLTFARITAPANVGKPMASRPEFKYIANMHGDEIVGRELMMKLIEDLASNYGKDDRVTNILNSIQVYILPSMNPDGATHQVRYNANGVDLNRDFPDWTTSDNQDVTTGRAPETQAVQKFQAQHHFKLSANFHGGAEVVNYPYDTLPDPFPLDNLVKKLSLDYAKKVPYIYNSTAFPQGITNGYAWYEVNGGMQDWSYHWYQDLQLTIELSNVKWATFSLVKGYYDSNRDALLTYIEDVLQVI